MSQLGLPALREAILALDLVRFTWCDIHGNTRCKTLTREAALSALDTGLGMVSSILLKDSADRTAYPIFEPEFASAGFAGLAYAGNLLLRPRPESFHVLPWSASTGTVACGAFFADGRAVPLDPRGALERAIGQLAQAGYRFRCGLELEFHVYRLHAKADDPEAADWPGPAPQVRLLHPGYHLLSEQHTGAMAEPFQIIARTARALGLKLSSLEIEIGPSQVEAVFEPTGALEAADACVLFRSSVREALAQAGYYATFVCRPPFPNIISSGWHLHQSLTDLQGRAVFANDAGAPGQLCRAYLAGLLEHARAMAAFCVPTINGFERFRPNALAPLNVSWGMDNRGALLRVVGQGSALRIENRLAEPAANPYLALASQIYAGLDGITQQRVPPPPTFSPYAQNVPSATRLPSSLGEALDALQANAMLREAMGTSLCEAFAQIKRAELARFEAAPDKLEFMRREYFARL